MKKLTSREWNLLALLAVFLVAVAFLMLVLLPQLERKQELETRLESSSDEALGVSEQISRLAANTVRAEKLEDECAVYEEEFYPQMQSQEVDRLITDLVLRTGLDAKDLIMENTGVPALVRPFGLDEVTLAAQSSDGLEEFIQADPEELDEEEDLSAMSVAPVVYVCVVSLRVSGSDEDLWELIDLFTDGEPSIRVTEFQWEEAVIGQTGEMNPATLKMQLAVYMVEE